MSAGLKYDEFDWPWPTTPQAEPPTPPEPEEVLSPSEPAAEEEEEGTYGIWTDGDDTYRHFDSLRDFCALKPHPVNAEYKLERDRDASQAQAWYGVDDLQTALRICDTQTWPEGLARMREELDLMVDVPIPHSIKRRSVWGDQGDTLDIHRVYSGQLDRAWRRTVRRTRPASQSIVIITPLTIARANHADKAFWCGAAVIKLSDVLTQAGYNVSIIGMHSTASAVSNNRAFDSVVVKQAEAPLDVEALVASIAFAGFMRTKCFISINALPWRVGNESWAPMGLHCSYEEQLIVRLNLPASSIVKGVEDSVRDRTTAVTWVTRHLDLLAQVHTEEESW